MSEHTPGPWVDRWDRLGMTAEDVLEETRDQLAQCKLQRDDLLAACEAARVLTEWLLSEEGWNLGGDVVRDVEEVKNCTTAALAKAKGGQYVIDARPKQDNDPEG